MTAQKIYEIKADENGWRKLPTGVWVKLGNGVSLGNYVRLGDGVSLGNDVRLGDGVTSEQLNLERIEIYKKLGEVHRFTKWVTRDRMSPNWDGGTPLKYEIGATVEEPMAEVNSVQCAVGLHVFQFGHRPEWYGYVSPEHDLIPITVEVRSEDICFAGFPTMDQKLRVRKLKVID